MSSQKRIDFRIEELFNRFVGQLFCFSDTYELVKKVEVTPIFKNLQKN